MLIKQHFLNIDDFILEDLNMKRNEKDPRILRTRNLIKNAFLELVKEKDFESISVTDISQKATINRSTFYSHFVDKYELLEELISTEFQELVNHGINDNEVLDKENLKKLVYLLFEIYDMSYNKCNLNRKSVAPIFEDRIQLQLKIIINNMLINQFEQKDPSSVELMSIMISSTLYGSTKYLFLNKKLQDSEHLVNNIIEFIILASQITNLN